MRINLKDFYPFYPKDEFMDIPDDLAAELFQWERDDRSRGRKARRQNAYFSLDRNDGTEKQISFVSRSLEEEYELKITNEELHYALSRLPRAQAERIYAHYVDGVSSVDIAHSEHISKSAVNASISRGMRRIKNLLMNLCRTRCR